MRSYECMVMVRASGGEADMQATLGRIQELMKTLGAKDITVAPFGRREPPLPQKDGVPGCYAVFTFSTDSSDLVDSLQKQSLLWDEVLRVGTMRLGKKTRKVKAPSASHLARIENERRFEAA